MYQGVGRGLRPLPSHPEELSLGTLPNRAQRGPRHGLLQPRHIGGKTERGKDVPGAAKRSVVGPNRTLSQSPPYVSSPPWLGKENLGKGPGDGAGAGSTLRTRPHPA